MEFMAQLQSGLDDLKPSLFEILSEQQLASLLPPSLRYIITQLTYRYPRYLLRVLNLFDELYALLMLVVERYYLKTFGGGFTENFYGLKRERVLRIRGGEVPRAQIGTPGPVRETLKLRDTDIWKNLAVMIGLPYLKRKLDESYDIHIATASALGTNFNRTQSKLPANAGIKARMFFCYKWFLKRAYPSLNAAYYFSLIAFNLTYLFGSSKYHSPFMWLIGTRIRRLGIADRQAILAATAAASAASTGMRRKSSKFSFRALSEMIDSKLRSSLNLLLPTAIFALKFLEWWHAADFARKFSKQAAEGLKLPPPMITSFNPISNVHPSKQQSLPITPVSASSSLPIFTVLPPAPETSALCPICVKHITNPTASPYGHVYCYVCIHQWVEGVHERQVAFMEGSSGGKEGWGGEDFQETETEADQHDHLHHHHHRRRRREGKWESGKGRDAINGKRILGGADLLRRVIV